MMKAAYIKEVGSPNTIIVGELPVPTISPTEILVKVLYTTVNHVDCYIRSGKYPQALPNPFIIGRDFCGEVVQTGLQVKNFKSGDRVWSHCQGIEGKQGTFAQFIAVSEDTLFHLPEKVDPLSATAVLHAAFTAVLGLEREAQLRSSDTIYIHGAAGNVGAMVLQVAKAMGARVLASTHGQDKMDYCYSLGADAVIDYKEDITASIRKIIPQGVVDVFWNTARNHDFKLSLPLLARKGRYILMAGSGTESILPIGQLYSRDASIRGYSINIASIDEIKETGSKINTLLERRSIKTKINAILPLEEAGKAHMLIESGDVWGKIIIEL